MFRKFHDKLKNWDSELLSAVRKGDIERLVECVDKHGAKINKHFHSTCEASNTYWDNKNPFIIALLNNDIPMLKKIIEFGGKNEIQNYPILNEAYIGNQINIATLSYMIEQGACLSGVLPYAVSYGQLDAIEALLNAGSEINKIYYFPLSFPYLNHAMENYEHTVLMIAASYNNEDVVKLLLKKGADASIKDMFNRTAEEYTTEYSIKLLIRQAKENQISMYNKPSVFFDARINERSNHCERESIEVKYHPTAN